MTMDEIPRLRWSASGFALATAPRAAIERLHFAFGIHHLQGFKTMAKEKKSLKQHTEYHKDGSVWARGMMAEDVPTGYWEWFRKDGTKMRSGRFENGQQVGEWITYDKKGQKYKVTNIKPKSK
jgi:hypothetical protein